MSTIQELCAELAGMKWPEGSDDVVGRAIQTLGDLERENNRLLAQFDGQDARDRLAIEVAKLLKYVASQNRSGGSSSSLHAAVLALERHRSTVRG